MGVTGKGLKANGLHKQYMNGSQEDNNSAAKQTRTGGGVTHSTLRADGLHKSLANQPANEGAVMRSKATFKVNGNG